MNHSDSERFSTIVENIGYSPTDSYEDADLIVFNSCSVRQKAEDRVSGLKPLMDKLKTENSQLKIVLTGCMARRTWKGVSKTGSPLQMTQEDREKELKKQMPWIDVVLETKEFGKLPQKLGKKVNFDNLPDEYLSYKPKYKNKVQAYVPISTGCDHFCTYCIVPFARGGEVNRPGEEIIHEIENLVYKGYKDITLLGQTVNRWINPKYDKEMKKGMIANTQIPELNTQPLKATRESEPKDFLQLLQVLDEIPGNWWMTFISSHPNYMTNKLIEFIGSSVKKGKHMRPYIHFALQSGSNEILKRMNRRYTLEEFTDRADKMRKEIPGVTLTTDIIVGFPGETEDQFQETVKAMEDLSFDLAYINEYSPRKGTASALLKDNVPHKEKGRRKKHLNDLVLAKTSKSNKTELISSKQKVLVTKIKEGLALGKTKDFKDVKIIKTEKPLEQGSLVDVVITGATNWSLEGKLI